MSTPNKHCGARFRADTRGNTLMIFGLSLMPVMLMLGASADYANFAMSRAALQQATDSAVLSAASRMSKTITDAEAKKLVQATLTTNARMSGATVLLATLSDDKQTLCATSKVTVKNAFMTLAKIMTLEPEARACANLAGASDPNGSYEIALVLDNSGSMSSSAGGKSKMQALRESAKSFVDTMYAKSGNVKVAVTPFAANVKVLDPATDNSARNLPWIDKHGESEEHWRVFGGKAAATAQGFTSRFSVYDKLKTLKSSWDWAGCLEEPKYPLNVNDTTPNPSEAETLFVPYLAPDEPNDGDYGNDYLADTGASNGACSGGGVAMPNDWAKLTAACKYATPNKSGGGAGPHNHCPTAASQTLMQLTPTQNKVTAKIAALQEGGYTNLHEGFMWGWRTLSPNLPFAGGRAYNAPHNRKVMVFMTDGFNNWLSAPGTATGSSYQAAGYYSYNGVKNPRFPDGSAGKGVNYQELLRAAANKGSDFHDLSRDMQDELTLEACANAKSAGIEVFTIGFSTPSDPIDSQGLALMKTCATNPDHYFKAENATQLSAAFESIGAGLGKLRLSE